MKCGCRGLEGRGQAEQWAVGERKDPAGARGERPPQLEDVF